MATTDAAISQPPNAVVIVPKGCLTATAIGALRRAGYSVIQAADPAAVKLFVPVDVKQNVLRAKAAVFDYATTKDAAYLTNKDDLRRTFLFYLKVEGIV